MNTALTMRRRALLKSAALGAVAGLTGRAAAATPLASNETPAAPALPTRPSIEADLPAVERTLGLSFTDAERKQLARGYDDVLQTLARLREITFPNDLPPAARFDPRLPGKTYAKIGRAHV